MPNEHQTTAETTVAEETTTAVENAVADANNNGDAVNPAKTNDNSEDIVGGNYDGYKGREHTRSKMALLFVLGFFAIQFLCIVFAIKVDATIDQLKDILVAVIGALSGTLGFIVGYYYKSSHEQ